MPHRAEQPPVVPDYSVGAEQGEDASPDLWSHLKPNEAPLARAAIVRAAALERMGASARDAYLIGIADAIGYKHLQELDRQLDQ